MDKYFNVHFICDTNNNEWWSNHALMSMQLLLNQHIPTPPNPLHSPLLQTTNDRGVCEQTTVPGCALCTNNSGSPSQTTVWGFGTTSVPHFRTRNLGLTRLEKNLLSTLVIFIYHNC